MRFPASAMASAVALSLAFSQLPRAQDLPAGSIIDNVVCANDPAQSYALYIPSNYSPNRSWNLLMAFHPAARGRAMVEKYQAAAEKYGYIVAGSNQSRNGPWAVSAAAVRAMSMDLGQRFSIDGERLYLTGMSGGARVALQVALGPSNKVAGVIASSAGYPDSKPRTSLPFALFSTAGTEDFNYIEMRQVDRALKSPHRLAVFEGGHTLPPDSVALEAIEWLELQAMTSGRRAKNEPLIAQVFESRQRALAAAADNIAAVQLLEALVDDFKGLRDVSAEETRLAGLSKQPEVKKALARQRSDDDAEVRLLREIFDLENGLATEETRQVNFSRLRSRLGQLAKTADAPEDSPARSQARRVLRVVTSGGAERVEDPEYRKLLAQYRQPRG